MSVLRLCCVGDSITSGQGDALYLGWPGRVGQHAAQQGHDCTIYNLGIRGETSDQIVERWLQECQPRLAGYKHAAVVFAFGINDATEQDGEIRVPLERSMVNARTVLAEALNRRWHCLFVGPAPVDERRQPLIMEDGAARMKRNAVVADYNDALRHVAGEAGVPYLDLFASLSAEPQWSDELSDGLHPSAAGYDRMAAMIASWRAWQDLLNMSIASG